MTVCTGSPVLKEAEASAQTSTEYTERKIQMDKKKPRLTNVPPKEPGKSATKVLFLIVARRNGIRKFYSLTQGEDDEC